MIRAGLRWSLRGAPVLATFAVALWALESGVGVTDRPGLPEAGHLAHAYYAIGLFVLGGMDLGLPVGGPLDARTALWICYFLAPVITTGAVIEGALHVIQPRWLGRWMLRDHLVLVGHGQWGIRHLERLRRECPRLRVVVCDRSPLAEGRTLSGARFIRGDIRERATRRALRLHRARGVVLLTDVDLTNLEAAWEIAREQSELRLLVHVSEIGLFRRVERMVEEGMLRRGGASQIEVFNVHRFAARELYHQRLVTYFEETGGLDTVVIAGFGRFGQTVLEFLQRSAASDLGLVVIVDLDVRRRWSEFAEQVGFSDGFRHAMVAGDMSERETWTQVAAHLAPDARPVVVVGGDDTERNLRAAIMLRQPAIRSRFEQLYVRCLRDSAFVDQLAERFDFEVLNIERMIGQQMWKRHQACFSGSSRRAGSPQ